MSNLVRGLVALSLVLVVSACNRSAPAAPVAAPVQPALTIEPVFTGKFN